MEKSIKTTFPLSTVITAHKKCNKSINSVARTVLVIMPAPYTT
jgi:hypothetical protein